MATKRPRSITNDPKHEAPKHYEDEERQEIARQWFDYAIHAMNLAYLSEEGAHRAVLGNESILWGLVGVADELRQLRVAIEVLNDDE